MVCTGEVEAIEIPPWCERGGDAGAWVGIMYICGGAEGDALMYTEP